MRRLSGIALTVTGFLACPCHLFITLPLLLSLLGGTALGSVLSRNTGLIFSGAALYFIGALALGALLLLGPTRSTPGAEPACPTCTPDEANTPRQEWAAPALPPTPTSQRSSRL